MNDIRKGTTATRTITLTTASGEAFDLTGFTAQLLILSTMEASEPAKSITGTIDQPDSGIILLELSSSDTNLPAGKYYYDLVLTKLQADPLPPIVHKPLKGEFKIVD